MDAQGYIYLGVALMLLSLLVCVGVELFWHYRGKHKADVPEQ